MTDYVGDYDDLSNSTFAREARIHAHKLRGSGGHPESATITNGVIRWKSNNRVIPADLVALAVHIGLPVDVVACDQARDSETKAFLAEYRTKQRNRKPSAEERFEMRAAFGPGRTVVNVITGRKIRT